MKKLILAVLSFAMLAGCAPKADGICATAVEGVCIGRYMNGEIVAVGGVDSRFAGLKQQGLEIYGTVETTVVSWEK